MGDMTLIRGRPDPAETSIMKLVYFFMRTVLSIGGSDPTGGAGIQADLKTFTSLGVYGLSVPACLTAQNTRSVQGILSISSTFFRDQLETLLSDIRPDAVKTGMLHSLDAVRITGEKIDEYSLENLVVDPVTVSSSGAFLTSPEAQEEIKKRLFRRARAATPNFDEVRTFTGRKIHDEDGMKKAAAEFMDFGPSSVVITGGHSKDKAVDLFFDGKEFLFLEREKLPGSFHGTGCVFASAMAASLALGYGPKEAAVNANDFVWKALQKSMKVGKGMKILGM